MASSFKPAGEAPLALGVDFGTSGVRCAAIDASTAELVELFEPSEPSASSPTASAADASEWSSAVYRAVLSLPAAVRRRVRAIAVDATSASVTLLRAHTSEMPVKTYAHAERDARALELVAAAAPAGHTVRSSSSSLCKAVAWLQQLHDDDDDKDACAADAAEPPAVLLHQSDVASLSLQFGERGWRARLFAAPSRGGDDGGGAVRAYSDWNNALKLGFDPLRQAYPPWVRELLPPARVRLPEVLRPGSVLGGAHAALGAAEGCVVVAGSTDSVAAFVASGAARAGEACTSLGSTLAVKLLSRARIDDGASGVYSHRYFLDDGAGAAQWLVGGASNVGGRTLRELGFSAAQLSSLSAEALARMPPGDERHRRLTEAPRGFERSPPLYPLPPDVVGERFPRVDAERRPQLHRPDGVDDADFVHALLLSLATVEADGYAQLGALGAERLRNVWSAGGGADNELYTLIRAALLGVDVRPGKSAHASYGAALLAQHALRGR